MDSTCTLVENSDLTNASTSYTITDTQRGGGMEREGLGKTVGGASAATFASGHAVFAPSRFGGVPVAPLKLEEERPFSKAFARTATKVKRQAGGLAKADINLVSQWQFNPFLHDSEHYMRSVKEMIIEVFIAEIELAYELAFFLSFEGER